MVRNLVLTYPHITVEAPLAIQNGVARTVESRGSVSYIASVLFVSISVVSKICQDEMQDLQDRVEDHVREEQDSLDEDENDADRKRPTFCLAAAEKIMMQYASGGAFPLIKSKGNESYEANYQRSQSVRVGPGVETTAEIEPD